MKGTPGPRFEARFIKNELEAFLLYINEDIINRIVERTNEQMCEVRKKINADEFQLRYSDTDEEEIKCFFGLLYFKGLCHDTKQPTRELWYDNFSAWNVYRVEISLNRCEWLMKTIRFHDNSTVRADFLGDRFASMIWFLTEFESNARIHYRHMEFLS